MQQVQANPGICCVPGRRKAAEGLEEGKVCSQPQPQSHCLSFLLPTLFPFQTTTSISTMISLSSLSHSKIAHYFFLKQKIKKQCAQRNGSSSPRFTALSTRIKGSGSRTDCDPSSLWTCTQARILASQTDCQLHLHTSLTRNTR